MASLVQPANSTSADEPRLDPMDAFTRSALGQSDGGPGAREVIQSLTQGGELHCAEAVPTRPA
jgi:hypothetical protein